ncbi:uncharacterized protein ACJ7VT_017714 [Polymixia lowei]
MDVEELQKVLEKRQASQLAQQKEIIQMEALLKELKQTLHDKEELQKDTRPPSWLSREKRLAALSQAEQQLENHLLQWQEERTCLLRAKNEIQQALLLAHQHLQQLQHSSREVEERWPALLNQRLEMDSLDKLQHQMDVYQAKLQLEKEQQWAERERERQTKSKITDLEMEISQILKNSSQQSSVS